MKAGKVAIALRIGTAPDPAFFMSWTRLMRDGLRPGDVVLHPAIGMPHACACNFLISAFLSTDCDSVLFIDDDMVFDAAALNTLRDADTHHLATPEQLLGEFGAGCKRELPGRFAQEHMDVPFAGWHRDEDPAADPERAEVVVRLFRGVGKRQRSSTDGVELHVSCAPRRWVHGAARLRCVRDPEADTTAVP